MPRVILDPDTGQPRSLDVADLGALIDIPKWDPSGRRVVHTSVLAELAAQEAHLLAVVSGLYGSSRESAAQQRADKYLSEIQEEDPKGDTERLPLWNWAAREPLLEAAWACTASAAQHTCGRVLVVPDGVTFASCDSPHSCPRCTPWRRTALALKARKAMSAVGAAGYSQIQLRLSLAHTRDMPLSPTIDALQAAWSSSTHGRPWSSLRARCQIAGWLRPAPEVTWSEASGWNPHLQIAMALKVPADTQVLSEIRQHFATHWPAYIELLGFARPDKDHCVYVGEAWEPEGLGAYILKGSPVYRMFLSEFTRTGDIIWRDRYQEFEKAMKGRRALPPPAGIYRSFWGQCGRAPLSGLPPATQ